MCSAIFWLVIRIPQEQKHTGWTAEKMNARDYAQMNGPQKYVRKQCIDVQSQTPQENPQTGGFLKRR